MRMLKSWLILGLWAALMIAASLRRVATDADGSRRDEEQHERVEHK